MHVNDNIQKKNYIIDLYEKNFLKFASEVNFNAK